MYVTKAVRMVNEILNVDPRVLMEMERRLREEKTKLAIIILFLITKAA